MPLLPTSATVGDLFASEDGRIYICSGLTLGRPDWVLVSNVTDSYASSGNTQIFPSYFDEDDVGMRQGQTLPDMLTAAETAEELRKAQLDQRIQQLAGTFKNSWEEQRRKEQEERERREMLRRARAEAVERVKAERKAAIDRFNEMIRTGQTMTPAPAKNKTPPPPAPGPKGRRFDFD